MSATDGLPPGPPLPGVVQTVAWGVRPISFFDACRRRYGPTFTIRFYDGSPIVVLSEPEDLRALFALGPHQFEAGRDNADILEPFLGARSLLLLDGDEHREERRRLQHVFRAEGLETYRRIIVDAARAEMATWSVGEAFPMHDRTRTITLEAILRAVFGAAGAELDGLRAALGPFLADGSASVFVLIPPFRHSLGSRTPWARFLRQRSAVHTEVRALIARRRAAGHLEERTDMLSALLQAGSDDDQLLDELMTLVLAGHDTTATALAWAFDLLLHHPAVLERLRAALATGDGDETYLDAVVHEVLRLRPIISEVARKPYEPFAASTGELPAGTNLIASIFLAQTDPARYADPRSFRPERFLDRTPDLLAWLPFGGGARRCLGAGFATLEVREVLRTVVSAADLEAVDTAMERPKRRAVTLIPRHGCRVRLRTRVESPVPVG